MSLKLRFQSLKYVLTYSFKELRETLVDNCFHNLAIDVSKPNRHHGSNDKQSGEEVDIARLFARPVRQHNFGQLRNSLPKQTVHIASSFFTPLEAKTQIVR